MVKFIFFSFNITLPNINIYLSIYTKIINIINENIIHENNFLMFYNVSLFSVKSVYCINFKTSFLLIKQMNQQ